LVTAATSSVGFVMVVDYLVDDLLHRHGGLACFAANPPCPL
jgi:hypothetical protein